MKLCSPLKTAALVAALTSAQAQALLILPQRPPAEQWHVTYKITGTRTMESASGGYTQQLATMYPHSELNPNTRSLDTFMTAGGGVVNGVTKHGRAEIDATVETKLKWLGPAGTAPAKQAICLEGGAVAQASTTADLNVTNGLRSPVVSEGTSSGQPSNGGYTRTLWSSGRRYRLVKVEADGTIQFTTRVKAFAKSVGSVRASTTFRVTPCEFGVSIRSDRDETTGRKTGTNEGGEPVGVPVKNGFQGDGRFTGDTVMSYHNLDDPDPEAIVTGYYGGTFDALTASIGVPHLAWGASGLQIVGHVAHPTVQTEGDGFAPTGTREATMTLNMNDELSGLSDDAEYVMRIHAALEKETTIGEAESGDLSKSSHPSIKSEFQPIVFEEISNTGPTVLPIESEVNVSHTKESGWKGTINGSVEFPVKIVKLLFGASSEWETKSVTQLGLASKVTINIAPNHLFQRRVVMYGTVQKWLCSSWQQHGWAGDSQHLVLSNLRGVQDFHQYAIGGSGGGSGGPGGGS